MEILAAIIIVGVVATVGFVSYRASTESAYDKEAKANLQLLRAAQESYFIDMTTYYPAVGSTSNLTAINSNLRVYISASTGWTYTVFSNGCSQAASANPARTWHLDINDADGEPDSGGC